MTVHLVAGAIGVVGSVLPLICTAVRSSDRMVGHAAMAAAMILMLAATVIPSAPVAHHSSPVTVGLHSTHHATVASGAPYLSLTVLALWGLTRLTMRLSSGNSNGTNRAEAGGMLLMMGSMGVMATTA